MLFAEQKLEQARGAFGAHDDRQPQNVFDLVNGVFVLSYFFFNTRKELDWRESDELRLFAVDVLAVHVKLRFG